MTAYPRRSLLLTVSILLAAIACTDKGDTNPEPEPEPEPEPSFWLVGDTGTMFGVTIDGEASSYPLEHDQALLAIACLGARTAWVVGASGTVLRSRDAGETWDPIDLDNQLGLATDWTALAVAEATPEGLEALWFVGREGAIAHTPDGGRSWISIASAPVDFSGVATQSDGDLAIAVATDGSIWQLDATGASLIHEAGAALHGVAISHAGRVAVGADGLMLRSEPAALDWTTVALPTDRDLHAVRVSHAGDLTIAVGEAGVVVRVEQGIAEAVELADAEAGLYGLHLRHDGRGQAVGGAGTLLVTDDAGLSWETLSLPTTATLRGVDDFHEGGHL
jgi:photosystem II stability/assembly factor-like uncharacterized protein